MKKEIKNKNAIINKSLLQKSIFYNITHDSGITLIALVITIIVLLILAGVAISTLTGDNGLLQKTQYSAEQMKVAKFKDEAGLAYLELYSQNAMDQNYEVGVEEWVGLLHNNYGYNIGISEEDYYVELNGMYYPISLSDSNIIVGEGTQDVEITLVGGGSEPEADPIATFGDAHPTLKADFGKKVSGYYAKAGSNWRLFYADKNFAYLISYPIGYRALNDSTLFSDFSTATMSDLGKNLNSKCSNDFWTNNAGNNNVKGISGLLNTAKWTDCAKDASNNDIANWAIGAPTVEMFIASYNATHTTQLSCTVDNANWTGYKVRKGSEDYDSIVQGLGNSLSVDTAIFCNGSFHWWLSSTLANSNTSAMVVSGSGSLSGQEYNFMSRVRPLVSVPISRIGTGAGKIEITDSY